MTEHGTSGAAGGNITDIAAARRAWELRRDAARAAQAEQDAPILARGCATYAYGDGGRKRACRLPAVAVIDGAGYCREHRQRWYRDRPPIDDATQGSLFGDAGHD